MVYEKDGWKLYSKDVKLKNTDKTQKIYFLAKKTPRSGTPCDLPPQYIVAHNKSLYYVKRK